MGTKEDSVEENPRESDRKDAAQSSGGSVAEFDYSVENFFAGMDAIGDLCGMPRAEDFDANEIERFSSVVTFLKEWKFFHYETKVISFSYEQAKDLPEDVKLPQFSAASVPKVVELPEARKQCNSTDFMLHAGGLVWALDWCPGNHGNQDSKIKCEYLAVAAHPPSSAYHKIGAPLIGRGVIQIWCLLNLDEDIEIPITRTQARGRPRKKHVEQKPDADGVEVSATPMPRGRPRKYPAKEKPTVPRPRGRPRKRPASSSDEENLTPTKSHGRQKKLLSSALDQNDLEDLSPENLIGTPKKSCATISSDDCATSSRKPRGRPRKHPLPVIIDVDEDTPALDNNGITSTLDMHSAKKSLVTISSGDSASSSRKPRGRPRKHPLPAIIDVNDQETPLLNNNGIPSTVDIIVPSCVDSRKDSVDVPISSSIECQDQLIQPRLRERQKKNPVHSAHFSVSSSLVSGNDVVILPSEPGTTVGKELSFCSGYEVLETEDNVLPLSESQNNSLSCPVFATRKSKEELAQHSMKKPISLSNSISQALVELQDDVTILPNLSSCGALDGGQELPACCNHEKFKSGESFPSVSIESQNKSKGESSRSRGRGRTRKGACLKLDVFEPASTAVLRKVSEEMYDPINEGQKKLESSPFNAKERREEEKKENTDGRDCENPILSEFCKDHQITAADMPTHENRYDNLVVGSSESVDKSISQAESVSPIPQDLALPRVVFCLAHNGKVAWDVKWRPATASAARKERMGYLAVLLGNGSLEVWEIPVPGMVKTLFKSSYYKDTDPRFLKLTPVFRCSKVERGDKQSIPLTMEWSPSFPHDLILAGCHDGTVVLWKFSTNCSSEDTRPLLCFIADSTPIRSLAWAPSASDLESNNLFVTAGHEGIKLWDIRDPYRALWEVNPVQRAVLSLDWVNDTRCIVMTLDDGTMKILSLCNAASDVPITGKPFAGTKYQGLHSYTCSSVAIWSIHVSRTTGFAAYCCADGSTIRFQLTTKSVDKDPRRNRMPHFLCGSLSAEGGTLKIHTPLPNAPLSQVPFTQKKPSNECGNANSSMDQTQLFSPLPASCSEDNQGVDQATVEGQGTLVKKKKKDEGSKEEFEVLPPKIVAMHRVRWNMNRGSERWLCYGGAAGVVRCQRINLS